MAKLFLFKLEGLFFSFSLALTKGEETFIRGPFTANILKFESVVCLYWKRIVSIYFLCTACWLSPKGRRHCIYKKLHLCGKVS